MRYEWTMKGVGSNWSGGKKGFVEADTVPEAKRKATIASGTGHWKKAWRNEHDFFVKYDGDGRKSAVTTQFENQAENLCVLRECPE